MATNISIFVVVSDILYTVVLSEVNLTGRVIKICIVTLVFICLINIYYLPRVSKIKKVLEVFSSRDEPVMNKWEEV